MSNQWCDTCGGLVDRIGLRPQGVRFCECRETIEKLRAKLVAERERADYAWKNTRLIDADRQRVTEERDGLRADLAALRAENEALRDDCSRLASYNAEESAHLRTRAEKAEADAERLRNGIAAVSALIADSSGVYGLHLNGDPAPWDELLSGGRFEEWLADFDAARGES